MPDNTNSQVLFVASHLGVRCSLENPRAHINANMAGVNNHNLHKIWILPYNQSELFQLQDHLMRTVVDVDVFCVDHQFGLCGRFVWIRYPCEFLDFSFPRQLIEALAVALLAYLEAGGDVDLDKGAETLDICHGQRGESLCRARSGRRWRCHRFW